VVAIVFTHSHVDHFGGVAGVLPEDPAARAALRVVAPARFLEEATSENVMAGIAMGRRASFMYGVPLARSERGHVDTGLGKEPARGRIGILPPTELVDHTPQEMTIDGVRFVFQYAPESEAPAELTFYLPDAKAWCGAEIVSHTLHNLYTLRGAKVRDALRWSGYIDEAMRRFADAEVVFASHHWPTWGRERVRRVPGRQRDTYKYIHDQTLRLANQGATPREIAEQLELPARCSRIASPPRLLRHGPHNAKAVYQGTSAGTTATRRTWTRCRPKSSGRRYVEAMGGRTRCSGRRARRSRRATTAGWRRCSTTWSSPRRRPRGPRAARRQLRPAGLPGGVGPLARRVPDRRARAAPRRPGAGGGPRRRRAGPAARDAARALLRRDGDAPRRPEADGERRPSTSCSPTPARPTCSSSRTPCCATAAVLRPRRRRDRAPHPRAVLRLAGRPGGAARAALRRRASKWRAAGSSCCASSGSDRPARAGKFPIVTPAGDLAAMDRCSSLVQRALASPAFLRHVEAQAPAIARMARPNPGVLLGFDFHLGGAVPQLIEINTNPGGLLVNLHLARAVSACCEAVAAPLGLCLARGITQDELPARIVGSFRKTWADARGSAPLTTVAIVDDDPAAQYLYPEFRLFERMFRDAGLEARIVDATRLQFEGGRLLADGMPVDLVYNRLTDFYLAEDAHAALRGAFESGAAVLTPSPADHAHFADKRLLAWLRDESLLQEAGLTDDERAHLQRTIPATEIVDPAAAASLWERRKDLFFKPIDGYGGKAAYRGDKLTRSKFEHVLARRYVAQAVAPPSTRQVVVDGQATDLKADIRNFVFDGATWMRAARLYSGQTTNFRTPGGGFAPVLELPQEGCCPGGL
jgi:hypothetical protein